jgi:hypothetical protein
MGPFSASTGGGRHAGANSVVIDQTLGEAVAEAQANGFKVAVDDGTAIVSKRWTAVSLTAVRGGTEMHRITSTWTIATWLLILGGILTWIWLA